MNCLGLRKSCFQYVCHLDQIISIWLNVLAYVMCFGEDQKIKLKTQKDAELDSINPFNWDTWLGSNIVKTAWAHFMLSMWCPPMKANVILGHINRNGFLTLEWGRNGSLIWLQNIHCCLQTVGCWYVLSDKTGSI